jgi:hypothetical protein
MSHHRAAETLGARARATGVQALRASLARPSGEKGRSPGSQHQPTRAFGSPPGPAGSNTYRDGMDADAQTIRSSRGEWLFHYTTLQTAMEHILPTLRLRLNPFTKMRDPREYAGWAPSVGGWGGRIQRRRGSCASGRDADQRPEGSVQAALVHARRS